ncbi:MAG: hypothetical protein CML42_07520 [Rhodobacteraceae bacterium]|nr:hypothetical protein [Paracoccaceae bacterium]
MAGNQMLGNLAKLNTMVDFTNKNKFVCDSTCQQAAQKKGDAQNFMIKVNEYAALMDVTKNTNLLSLQKKYYNSLGTGKYNNMLKTKTDEMWRQKKIQLKAIMQNYKSDIIAQLDALNTQDIYINKHSKFLNMSEDEKKNISNKIKKRKSDKNINNRLSYYYEQKMSGIFLLNLILVRLYYSLIVILFIVTFFKQQYRQPIVLVRLLIFFGLPYLLMPKVKKYV